MIKHKLPSGAELGITPLPVEEAWAVTQAVLKEIGQAKLDLKGMDLEKILASDVMAAKDAVCALLASDIVLEATKKCFSRCTYNSVKIADGKVFEPVEARRDFLFAAFYGLKENIYPFFGSLISFLQAT